MKTICFEELVKYNFNFYSAEAFRQYWKNKSTFSYMQTPRPNNGLTLICCDTAMYTLENGVTLTAKKGDVVCIAKHARYEVSFSVGNPSSHATVLFNFLLSDDDGSELSFDAPLKIICSNVDREIYRQFRGLGDIYENNVYTGPNFKIMMYELICRLSQKSAGAARNYGILKGVEYIDSHLGENMKIAEIAAVCAMSESAFRQKFKKQMGVSPIKYITKAKIEKAKQLLASSELSVEEISHALCFYDTAYFYKIFKDITGTLPSAYRPS